MRIKPAAICLVPIIAIACAGSPTEPSPTPLSVALDRAAWQTIRSRIRCRTRAPR